MNQILRVGRKSKTRSLGIQRGLQGSPIRKGICVRVFTRTPKKPNSAKRKTLRLFIPLTKSRLYVGIIGIGHNLQKWSNVLIRGGRRRDIPGVRYVTIRGKYDLRFVHQRRTKRSKYGIKRFV